MSATLFLLILNRFANDCLVSTGNIGLSLVANISVSRAVSPSALDIISVLFIARLIGSDVFGRSTI
jgi:hypothetical protein